MAKSRQEDKNYEEETGNRTDSFHGSSIGRMRQQLVRNHGSGSRDDSGGSRDDSGSSRDDSGSSRDDSGSSRHHNWRW